MFSSEVSSLFFLYSSFIFNLAAVRKKQLQSTQGYDIIIPKHMVHCNTFHARIGSYDVVLHAGSAPRGGIGGQCPPKWNAAPHQKNILLKYN